MGGGKDARLWAEVCTGERTREGDRTVAKSALFGSKGDLAGASRMPATARYSLRNCSGLRYVGISWFRCGAL